MKTEFKLDGYLQELIQNRSSSQLKLIAAWDGLTTETQIKILHLVDRIPDQIIKKSLNSKNDYVRYLIINKFGIYHFEKGNEEEKEFFEKMCNDSGIAKYAHKASQRISVPEQNEHGHTVYILKPENFFAMPHEEQILYFSQLSIRDGEEVAKIIEWGFNQQIDQDHLADLINELSYNFKQDKLDYRCPDPEDGFGQYLYAKNLEALWKLIPKLGETKPAKYLIWSLPTSTMLFDDNVIEEVIKSLPKKLIIYLLKRKDLYMFDLRKKISKEKIYDDEIKTAAISKLKDPKATQVEKQEKREITKSFALIALFIFGLGCIFLNVNNWIAYMCIGIPVITWIEGGIKEFFNSGIDDIVDKVDKRLKKRLRMMKGVEIS